MRTITHRQQDRGKGEYGWLSTRYSFSFADWYEPSRMGFGALRVINDDRIAPANGFGMHSHQDMEIITIVLTGAVTHKDSLGNVGTVAAGDVQVMSAGTGVSHSEYNDSETEPLELFQIWIEPKTFGIAPAYAQKHFGFPKSAGSVQLVGKDGLAINQDAGISYVVIDKERPAIYDIVHGNGVYVFMIEGEAMVTGEKLSARDALGIMDASSVVLNTDGHARLLVIEVPMGEEGATLLA
jgi:redox-sensitive bicupin YhaK (pirin superfamily)